jgi:hypothetical protein
MSAHHQAAGNEAYVFQDRGRIFTEISDKIFVDVRVPGLVGAQAAQDGIKKRVGQVLEQFGIRPHRVEVVPYRWPHGGSLVPVAIACDVTDVARVLTHPNTHTERPLVKKTSSILVPYGKIDTDHTGNGSQVMYGSYGS